MRFLLRIFLIAALLFGGYWFFAAQMITRQGTAVMGNAAQLDGRVQPVTGFPMAFRTRIDDPALRSRDGFWGWSASEIALSSASYQPNRIRADFPTTQTIRLGGFDHALEARGMQGALDLGLDQTLRAATLELDAAQLTPDAPLTDIGPSTLGLRQIDGARYLMDARIEDLTLAPATLALVSPDESLPDQIASIVLSAEVEFAEPLPLRAPWPEMREIDLRQARLDWGDLQGSLSGTITRNAAGLMDGQIALELEDWQPFHALLIAQGVLPPDAAMLAGMFLASQAAAGSNAVTLPLEMRESVLSLGPFALLQLPRF